MDLKKALKNLLRDSAVIFMIATVLYAGINTIVNVNDETVLIEAPFLLYLFIFSVLAAISQLIYRIDSINKALRVAIQAAIILFSSYVCLFLPMEMQGSHVMVGLAAVILIYSAGYAIGSFFIWKFKQNTKKEEEYTSKFKKNKKTDTEYTSQFKKNK